MAMNSARNNAFGTIGFGFMMGIGLLALFVIIPGGMSHALQEIETHKYPVTSKAHVYNVRLADGGSMVSATAEKLRDCDWLLTEFRFGPRDGRSVPMPRAAHVDPPQLNVKGDVMVWENIFLPVSPEKVMDTHWNAYHLCYPVLKWETETEFFN